MWRKVIRSDFTPVPNCKLPFPDETMRLEVTVNDVTVDDVNGADAGEEWKKGKEIRVVRGKRKKKKHVNKFAPTESNR